MKVRPIDANALKQSMGIEDAVKYGNETEEQQHNSYATLMNYEIADYIDDMPTLDYALVVHAEWLPIEEPQWNCFGLVTIGYRCSECGREEPYNHEPFCHCGAKMDGGKENA